MRERGENYGKEKQANNYRFFAKNVFTTGSDPWPQKRKVKFLRLLFLCLRDSDSCKTTQKWLTPVFHAPLSEGTLVVASF